MLPDYTWAIERSAIADAGAPAFVQVPTPPVDDLYIADLWVAPNGEVWLAGSSGLWFVARGQRNGDDVDWSQSLLLGPALTLQAIHGLDHATTAAEQEDVWALASDKMNFHHTVQPDGGQSWGPVPSATNITLNALWVSGKDDAWAVGNLGFVRHWDGASWKISQLSVQGRPIFDDLASVHGSSANDVWAVGRNVIVHHTGGGK
jgi:hypothetical protein